MERKHEVLRQCLQQLGSVMCIPECQCILCLQSQEYKVCFPRDLTVSYFWQIYTCCILVLKSAMVVAYFCLQAIISATSRYQTPYSSYHMLDPAFCYICWGRVDGTASSRSADGYHGYHCLVLSRWYIVCRRHIGAHVNASLLCYTVLQYFLPGIISFF